MDDDVDVCATCGFEDYWCELCGFHGHECQKPNSRPHIRVHADGFNTTITVSGARVTTAVLTWYRNGQRHLPPMRELLHVIEKGL